MIGRRHSRVIPMRQRASFRLQPGRVFWRGRCHQGERSSQCVDDFLQVPKLMPQPFGAPVPPRWKLPLGEMLGQRIRNALNVA